ncbi:MAG: hypothetical protein HY936_05480 [Nitrosomonadales bacterium]|nr:hypothetical protein [Nitrosomonadales bacterium]
MNIAEIESSLKELVEAPFDADTFIFRFLEIYDAPKAAVTKLRQGTTNHAKEPGELLWKNKLFFRVAEKGQAAATVDAMADDPLAKKHSPRFLLATDGEEVCLLTPLQLTGHRPSPVRQVFSRVGWAGILSAHAVLNPRGHNGVPTLRRF